MLQHTFPFVVLIEGGLVTNTFRAFKGPKQLQTQYRVDG